MITASTVADSVSHRCCGGKAGPFWSGRTVHQLSGIYPHRLATGGYRNPPTGFRELATYLSIMPRLYIAPIGSTWMDDFERTVESPVRLPEIELPPSLELEDEVRIWGTTAGGFKDEYFRSMQTDDPILFYSEGEFFASGRVGTTVEDQNIGEAIWGNTDSKYIYTISDYEQISVSVEDLSKILGYDDG